MLSIKAIGKVEYYLELAREDYYLQGGEPAGKWWGRGAAGLGLSGTTDREDLRSLAAGFSPEGTRLVQNAGQPDRQVGWDLTFSAPKSVSVVWSHSTFELRKEIQTAHDRAVSAALSYLEEEAAFTRRGKGGATREKASIVAATFQHGTSRALDPHLHTHSIVLNLAGGPGGAYRSLVSKPLYVHKTVAGTLYRLELAHELSRLGFQCEPDKSSFAVTGVPKAVLDHFSTRRKAIEAELASYGVETASAAAIATLATRKLKELVPPRGELFKMWTAAGESLGFTKESVQAIRGNPTHSLSKRHFEKALREALAEITQTQSHFSERELLLHVARASQTKQLHARYVRDALAHSLRNDPGIVSLGERNFEARYTTKEMFNLEKRLLETARSLSQSPKHAASSRVVNAVIAHYSSPRSRPIEEARRHLRGLTEAAKESVLGPRNASGHFGVADNGRFTDRPRKSTAESQTLTSEQAAAIRHLTETPGAVKVLSGYAGTGKTFLLNACREIWEKGGYEVIGASLSAKAARELASGSGIRSDTLRMLQLKTEPELSRTLKHHARQLLRAAVQKPTFKLKPFRPTAKTVLVVDEAGMIGTKDMRWLTDLAQRTGCKLVLTGEAEQLQPIDAGGPFAAIARIAGQAKLTEIKRQQDAEERNLVLGVRSGRGAEALEHLAARGRLVVQKSRSEAIKHLVSDWARTEAKDPSRSLIFSGTNIERAQINRRCQDVRKVSGLLGATQPLELEDAQAYKGDRVILRQNSRKLGVQNGNMGTVLRTNRLLKSLTVKLDSGRVVTLPLSSYRIRYGEKRGSCAVELGYAVTTHSGQGATVDRAYVLAGGSMQDRELSYVQLSRHVKSVSLYTDRFEAGDKLQGLIRQIQQSRRKDLAHDVLPAKYQSPDTQLAMERARW